MRTMNKKTIDELAATMSIIGKNEQKWYFGERVYYKNTGEFIKEIQDNSDEVRVVYVMPSNANDGAALFSASVPWKDVTIED